VGYEYPDGGRGTPVSLKLTGSTWKKVEWRGVEARRRCEPKAGRRNRRARVLGCELRVGGRRRWYPHPHTALERPHLEIGPVSLGLRALSRDMRRPPIDDFRGLTSSRPTALRAVVCGAWSR
jgi:hypothetical protein